MTNTITEAPTLSIDDVKAMNQAQYIVLFYRPDGSEGPKWGMRLGYEVRLDQTDAEVKLARIVKSGIWTRTYADDNVVSFVRVMQANEAFCTVENYGPHETSEAVWLDAGYLRPRQHVTSALDTIKAGDTFAVHFVGTNNSESTNKVGYVVDECYLRVIRPKHRKASEFMMGSYCGPNNSARIVK